MGKQVHIPMRELERATGFSRATIGFYIKKGLLPSPEKSARNMAYYDRRFIDKLQLIKKLKDADFSLEQIGQILSAKTSEIDVSPLLGLIRAINRLIPPGAGEQPVSLRQLEESGFDGGMVRRLMELSVITPVDPEKSLFPSYSITLCRLAGYFMDFGISAAVIRDVVQKMREMVAIEFQAFEDCMGREKMVSRSEEERHALKLECLENISALLPLLHMQLLQAPK